MGVLIKSMGMPLSCGYCALKKFKYGIGDDCLFGAKETEYQKRPTDCPLIEVPEPHGRLGDLDELKTAFPCGESIRTESVRATIDHMPTIIQASTE